MLAGFDLHLPLGKGKDGMGFEMATLKLSCMQNPLPTSPFAGEEQTNRSQKLANLNGRQPLSESLPSEVFRDQWLETELSSI
ncbi:hypothetical protein [Rahnella selenatireducens]|uniref:hypothetical protein n=1 Tax=Rahnella selenatireducens TaxID=3389797 RepID=UPI003968359F